MSASLHHQMIQAHQTDLARQTRYAHHASTPAPDQDTPTRNTRLRLVALATTIAVFALPIAEASAHGSW